MLVYLLYKVCIILLPGPCSRGSPEPARVEVTANADLYKQHACPSSCGSLRVIKLTTSNVYLSSVLNRLCVAVSPLKPSLALRPTRACS